MQVKLGMLILLMSFSLASIGQKAPKELKRFIPRGYTFVEAIGDLHTNFEDIILRLNKKGEDEEEVKLLMLRRINKEIIQIFENSHILFQDSYYGDAGATGIFFSHDTLTVSTITGSISYKEFVWVTFVKRPNSEYYFDSYTTISQNYGLENLFERFNYSVEDIYELHFDDADEASIKAIIPKYQIDISNAANGIKTEEEITIPEEITNIIDDNWSIRVSAKGDLNKDMYKQDYILLLQNDTFPTQTVIQLYLQQKDNSYKKGPVNSHLYDFSILNDYLSPLFSHLREINFENIKIDIHEGSFDIHQRVPDFDDSDFQLNVDESFSFIPNYTDQNLSFKYDAATKDWYSNNYYYENFSYFDPANAWENWEEGIIGKNTFADVCNFPNYTFYGGKETMLYGTLTEKIFYGEPGYGETPKIDQKIKVLVLETDHYVNTYPIAYNDDPEVGLSISRDNAEFQLYSEKNIDFKKYLGKKVALTGHLYPQVNAHQFTPVIMVVDKVKLK
ncbi:MAG: DUF4431 domain-containing protein [Brumimicrobium sp.]|nr:DUF4431 domain-containing protein [Brumimicrobium sp.]